MFEFIMSLDPITWWVIPSLVVCLIFLIMMRHDGMEKLDLEKSIVLGLVCIAWPLGAVLLVVVVWFTVLEHWVGVDCGS